jgi:hypothetical protein
MITSQQDKITQKLLAQVDDYSLQDLERLSTNQDDARHMILTTSEFLSIAEQTWSEENQAFELA